MVNNSIVHIVEDDPSTRRALQFTLEEARFRVKTYSTGTGFLRQYRDVGAACLLLDLHLPEMSGIQVLEHLRRHKIRLPIIVITAHADVESAVASLKLGAIDFLAKPLNCDRVVARVRDALQEELIDHEQHAVIQEIRRRLFALTPRERTVLRLVVQGLSNKMVAAELGIAIKTAAHHRERLTAKMAAANTADLVRMVVSTDPTLFLKAALNRAK